MNQNIAINVDTLQKTYSDGLIFGRRLQALKGVSFNVNQGEIFGLLGPNGAGKTTLVKILLGIIRKSSGRATMMGHPAGSRSGRQLVGYLPEHLRIPAHMTGHTALECYGNLSNVPSSVIRRKRGELLALVGLADRATDRVKKYSKGMLQRLGLAQALLHDPKLLVLDEPTDGLDPRARADMRQVIRELKKRGVTIFLNSHILQEVEMICERVAILDRGHLRYCGAVSEIGGFVNSLLGGSATGMVVEVEVRGDPEAVNQAFSNANFEIKYSDGKQNFRVQVKAKDQDEVDSLIDRLRSHGVSLIGLSEDHVTLEDAFLRIVDDPQQQKSSEVAGT